MSASDIAERLKSRHAYEAKHYPPPDDLWLQAAAEITRLRADITGLEDGNMTFLCDQLDKAKAENERLRSLLEEAGKVVEQLADELEPEVMNSGGSPRQIKRDMEPVVRARSLSTKLKGEGQ